MMTRNARYLCFQSIFLFLIPLMSCSSIHYLSGGRIPIKISERKESIRKRVIEGKKEFYLWGVLPQIHQVELDREFKRVGLISVGSVKIEEHQTNWDIFKSIISFGMFSVRRYKVIGYGKEPRDFED